MTQQHELNFQFNGHADERPPDVAPSFGDVPILPFEHTPERLVLSSEAHSYLLAAPTLAGLDGEFAVERLGKGNLHIRETGAPGEVQIRADVLTLAGPAVHLDARVRHSWLMRTVESEDAAPANIRIVRELFRLAEIPHQSTVTVRIDAD